VANASRVDRIGDPSATGRNWYRAPRIVVVIQPSVNRCVRATTRGSAKPPAATAGAAATRSAAPASQNASATPKCQPGSENGGAIRLPGTPSAPGACGARCDAGCDGATVIMRRVLDRVGAAARHARCPTPL